MLSSFYLVVISGFNVDVAVAPNLDYFQAQN
jgi:hypothetical protein